MKQTDWIAAARFNGFDRVELVDTHGGWEAFGVFPDNGSLPLTTARGSVRQFASLDTAAQFLRARGVESVLVQLHPDSLPF